MGEALYAAFENENFLLVCPEDGAVDWCNEDAVKTVIQQSRPAVIVNTLSISPAWSLKPKAATTLADVCKSFDSTVIHLSSHEVFGSHLPSEPYGESHTPVPTTDLGIAQLEAENRFSLVARAIVFRVSWLLDAPDGLLAELCRMLLQQDQINTTDQWRGSPVFIDCAATAIVAIIKQILCGAENWGVFHYHASDSCSEAELADLLTRLLSKEGKQVAQANIVPVDQRLMTCSGWMEGRRCTDDFGVQLRSWRKGVKAKVLAWLAVQAEQAPLFASTENEAKSSLS